MKRLQLLRWSGSVLSPRTRPSQIPVRGPQCERLKSTSTATALIQGDSTFNTLNDSMGYARFPSPPPERARKSAKLAALHARLALSSRLPLETLARCLVDETADLNPAFNNSSLALLGKDIFGYYAAELVLCQYPRIPVAVLFAAVNAYCGSATLTSVTQQWGVDVAAAPGGEVDAGLLQFKRVVAGNADLHNTGELYKDTEAKPLKKHEQPWSRGISSFSITESYFGEAPTAMDLKEQPHLIRERARLRAEAGITREDASTSFVWAVMGAIYLHAGRAATKAFFREHIQSRKLDVGKMFSFKQPTRDLSRLCAREGFEGPVARILSETGRGSMTPVYVVGVFSGKDKLGEGQGGSLDEARLRAAIAALKGWYLYSPLKLRVPSDVEGGKGEPWEPVLVDGGEVIV